MFYDTERTRKEKIWQPQKPSSRWSGPSPFWNTFQQCGGGERSVKEIADALELNKSTAFGLINTLTTLGYLQQNADNQKYVLSLKLLQLLQHHQGPEQHHPHRPPLSGADQPEIRRDRPLRRGLKGTASSMWTRWKSSRFACLSTPRSAPRTTSTAPAWASVFWPICRRMSRSTSSPDR